MNAIYLDKSQHVYFRGNPLYLATKQLWCKVHKRLPLVKLDKQLICFSSLTFLCAEHWSHLIVLEYWGLKKYLVFSFFQASVSIHHNVTCAQTVRVYFIIIFIDFFQLFLFRVIVIILPGNTWTSCCQLWKAFPSNSDHQAVAGLFKRALQHIVRQRSIRTKHLRFVSVIRYHVLLELLLKDVETPWCMFLLKRFNYTWTKLW